MSLTKDMHPRFHPEVDRRLFMDLLRAYGYDPYKVVGFRWTGSGGEYGQELEVDTLDEDDRGHVITTHLHTLSSPWEP